MAHARGQDAAGRARLSGVGDASGQAELTRTMADPDLRAFHGIIGRSPAMQTLFRRIERVAPHDVSVLIQGESGTGKELIARAVHRLSRRRERPLQTVNAGAFSRELLLSELFGHERGAFTGAVTRTAGLLAAAHGGTLFLDEVAELPPEGQVALLRFLQEGELRAVGSRETRRVDVRVIAATHRDLRAMIAAGTFREDLYYRLRWVVLAVPPLRERPDDIPLLAEHFRAQLNHRFGLAISGFSAQRAGMPGRRPVAGERARAGDGDRPGAPAPRRRTWWSSRTWPSPARRGRTWRFTSRRPGGSRPTSTRSSNGRRGKHCASRRRGARCGAAI